ncbi:MAG TPA: hypothetical protein VJ773_02150 [Gemmatimonadales bacterium]|nr:hypothetical protein [Gemmatimonadales bacterium]
MSGVSSRAAWVAVLVGSVAVAPLAAQDPRHSLYDKFQVNLSLTGVILNSDIRVDGSGGNGTDIDAEDDLGLATLKLQPRAALRWRPGRRHELEVGYQFARRTSEKTLEREIQFGDSTFEVGARVGTHFDTDQAFLNYKFAFMAKERTQLGVGIGLGALFFDAGLDVVATAGGGSAELSRATEVTVPVGSLGLYGRFLSGDRWRFDLEPRALALEIDRFDIRVIELGGAVHYGLSPKLALELGYASSWIRVKVLPEEVGNTERFLSGEIKYSLQSIRLGLSYVL